MCQVTYFYSSINTQYICNKELTANEPTSAALNLFEFNLYTID